MNQVEFLRAEVERLANPPRAQVVRKLTPQATTTSIYNPVIFDAVDFDTDRMWDASSPDRLTVRRAGTYQVDAICSFVPHATGARGCRVIRNNVGVTFTRSINAGGLSTALQVNATVECRPGDYFYLEAYQNSGGDLDTGTGQSGELPRLTVRWVSD